MTKRTYGTGSFRQLPSGKWYLEYKPKWSPKRLFKTVEALNEKAAKRLLSDWVTEQDKLSGPVISCSIEDLIELHITDMQVEGRDPINIQHVERRARKHLVKHFFIIHS